MNSNLVLCQMWFLVHASWRITVFKHFWWILNWCLRRRLIFVFAKPLCWINSKVRKLAGKFFTLYALFGNVCCLTPIRVGRCNPRWLTRYRFLICLKSRQLHGGPDQHVAEDAVDAVEEAEQTRRSAPHVHVPMEIKMLRRRSTMSAVPDLSSSCESSTSVSSTMNLHV